MRIGAHGEYLHWGALRLVTLLIISQYALMQKCYVCIQLIQVSKPPGMIQILNVRNYFIHVLKIMIQH